MEAFIAHGGFPPDYKCDISVNWTYNSWLKEGEPHLFLGLFSFAYGSVCIILYIPCCIVLLQPDLRSIFAYKMLLLISINQMINLFVNACMAGVFFILGVVYCNFPLTIYHFGWFVNSSYFCVCISCFVLTASRLVDVWSPTLHNNMFRGKRSMFSFFFIAVYSVVCGIYSKPVVFNSKELGWVMDPLVWPKGGPPEAYYDFVTIFNNEGTVSGTLFLTIAFVCSWIYKSVQHDFKFTSSQKQIFILCTVSNCCNLVVATIYAALQFFSGKWFNYIGLMAWEFGTVGELVLFYVVNQTIRLKLRELLFIRKKSTTTTVQVVSK